MVKLPLQRWRYYALLLGALLSPASQGAAVRAELLPGADSHDWLLIIEADGERRQDELDITPLLRQFAVGRVTMSRVRSTTHQLTRWQIPLYHSDDKKGAMIASLTLGSEQTPALSLPLPHPEASLAPSPPAAIRMEHALDHQGPIYPGQPIIYRLTLWLPEALQQLKLSELASPHFTIRRLGSDEWRPPSSRGLPGQLTRSWLLQARAPGEWLIDSPRLLGQRPLPDGQPQAVSARAAPLPVEVVQAPQHPVATALTLNQRFEPGHTGLAGEPLIRIITLRMEGGDSAQLPLAGVMARALPAGVQAAADGEQQQERFMARGGLYVEREWRQALQSQHAGRYLLPTITLPWFNTRSGQIEQATLPATWITFQPSPSGHPPADEARSPVQSQEALWWVLWALLLRALISYGPRWRAFYHLQRALRKANADEIRATLLVWAALRWPARYHSLSQLPCYHALPLSRLLAELDRACFSPASVPHPHWAPLARAVCAYEPWGSAHGIRLLTHLVPAVRHPRFPD